MAFAFFEDFCRWHGEKYFFLLFLYVLFFVGESEQRSGSHCVVNTEFLEETLSVLKILYTTRKTWKSGWGWGRDREEEEVSRSGRSHGR